MFKKIKNWFGKKTTIIFAPGYAGRSFHIRISHPFIMFLVTIVLLIGYGGFHLSKIYTGYLNAMETNRKLVKEKQIYSKQVDETLSLLQKVKNIDVELRGMIGMKSSRNIIENYHVGGTIDNLNLPFEMDSLYDRYRFEANVKEANREIWEQQQSIKKIGGFLDKQRDILLSTPSIWPTFGYLTSGYGWRIHPITGRKEFHRALDIYNVLQRNSPIRATARGKVVLAGWAGGLGRIVIIDHGNGFSTRYCHCYKIIVNQGEQVEQGQIIAYIGNTGFSTGPHLHYEVWHKGKPVNPMNFVKGR
ncbi:MAG: M23 family metallopeptidase [Elusimicrobiota bacterium]